MTDYAWPAAVPNPATLSHQLVTNTKRFTSPLTGATQTASRAGERWAWRMTWVNVSGEQRGAIEGLLNGLVGQTNRLLIPLAAVAHQQRGLFGGGSPRVDGSGQTGNSINLQGVASNQSPWAAAGDWVSIGDQLYQATQDVDSDGTGRVVLFVTPRIRVSPSNNTVCEVLPANIIGRFMLASDPEFQSETILRNGVVSSTVSAEFIEDVLKP